LALPDFTRRSARGKAAEKEDVVSQKVPVVRVEVFSDYT
jgi:hypothetical protein